MKKYDACDLSDLLKKEYRKEFNVPYLIMQDQRRVEMTVHNQQADQSLLDEFKQKGDEIGNIDETFESLVNDLCFRGKIDEGEYLLCFDD